MDVDYDFEDTKLPLSAMGKVIESIGMNSDSQVKCRACSQNILDKYFMKIDSVVVHEFCCRCAVCALPLTEKCHEKDGQLFCKQHYYSVKSPYSCCGCKQGISPTDMVYKLKAGLIFHVTCHSCFRCGRQLTPGEQILVDDEAKTVSCMTHYFEDQTTCVPSYPSTSTFPQEDFSEYNIKKEVDVYGYNLDLSVYSEYGDDESKFLKRRGPRTTIKQNQLDVLNQIFSNTPKPSKHARAKLALETGLSMRVIQVWFQNRRSKERRLKHLCNYLRHYEQRGLVPPNLAFNQESIVNDDVTFSQLNFGFEDEEEDD